MANKNDKGERKPITVNVKFQGQQKGHFEDKETPHVVLRTEESTTAGDASRICT